MREEIEENIPNDLGQQYNKLQYNFNLNFNF